MRRIAIAAMTAAASLLVTAGAVAAASPAPPDLTDLGALTRFWSIAQPVLTIIFVGLGLYAAVMMISRALTALSEDPGTNPDGSARKVSANFTLQVKNLGAVIALVVLALIVIWQGLPILNEVVKLTWTLFSDTTPLKSLPIPSPSA